MPNPLRDVSAATRRFRRSPLFFLGACTLVALAVGASTAIFTVVNAVILRPLPLDDAAEVVALHVVRQGTPRGAFPLPMYLELAAGRRTLEEVAAWFQWSASLTGEGDAERLQAMRATGNYLRVLGAGVALGRAMTAADAAPDRSPVAVIGDGLWKRRFDGSPDAIGRTIRLNDEVFTVIGVLGPRFPFPLRDAELIVSWVPERDARRTNAGLSFLRVVGRLGPGATPAQATAELTTSIQDYQSRYPDLAARDEGGRAIALADDLVGTTAGVLRMLALAVALVLVIAGVNLASLLLVNGTTRIREFATRRALGASARQVMAQLTAEALVVAIVSAAAGLVLARLAMSALLSTSAVPIPRAPEIALDGTSVLVALGLAVVISVGAAMLPAVQLIARAPTGGLAARSVTASGRTLRAWFVGAEVAVSVALVIWAGLLVRSFAAVQRVEPGFEPSEVLSLRLSLPRGRYKATQDLARFADELAARVRAVPGVSAVAAANVVPFNGYLATSTIQPSGFEAMPAGSWPDAHYRMVSPDYFTVMQIPFVSGRRFTDADNATGAPVAIVSRGLATRYWPEGNALDAALRVRDDADRFRTVQIVGVVGDVRHFGLEAESPPELYIPIPQVPDATSVWLANNMYWVAKTHGVPLAYATAVRREVAEVDADVASSFIRSMDDWMAQSVDARRFSLRVIIVFALAALLLSGIGIYGVTAESVAVRTREIGVRSALGASDLQLKAAIVSAGLGPVIAGAVLGSLGALGLAGMLRPFLYGVAAHDPLTFLVVFLAVAAIGAIALYVPARRVTRIEPVVALRIE